MLFSVRSVAEVTVAIIDILHFFIQLLNSQCYESNMKIALLSFNLSGVGNPFILGCVGNQSLTSDRCNLIYCVADGTLNLGLKDLFNFPG